jgi:hypothetical protein
MRKIAAMALNSTYTGRGTSLILYLGVVVMPKCSSRAQSLPVGTGSPKGLHLIRLSVHHLNLSVAQGRVLLIGVVFYVMVLLLLLLLSR